MLKRVCDIPEKVVVIVRVHYPELLFSGKQLTDCEWFREYKCNINSQYRSKEIHLFGRDEPTLGVEFVCDRTGFNVLQCAVDLASFIRTETGKRLENQQQATIAIEVMDTTILEETFSANGTVPNDGL